MRILLDPQIFQEQRMGGVSRYFAELLFHTPKIDEAISIDCPLPYHINYHLLEKKLLKPSSFNIFLANKKFKGSATAKKYLLNYQRDTLKKLKKQDFDIFIPTYYDAYFLKKIGNKPFVLTVYDMIHELFPFYFTKDNFTAYNKKLLVEKATSIIAISQSTKDDILKIYPHIPKDKINVVYLSQSINTKKLTKHIDTLPEKYILFVGNRGTYKNFIFFIESITALLKKDKNIYVVCAGGSKFKADELALLTSLEIANQVIQQNFDDDDLASYYHHAQLFVFPSLYEGFGIPILEAMACGCPVVLSAHSSFVEVAGDAGIYFEKENAEDLVNKVQEILSDNSIKQKYIAAGHIQASKFSWEKTAKACLDVYKKAINER